MKISCNKKHNLTDFSHSLALKLWEAIRITYFVKVLMPNSLNQNDVNQVTGQMLQFISECQVMDDTGDYYNLEYFTVTVEPHQHCN